MPKELSRWDGRLDLRASAIRSVHCYACFFFFYDFSTNLKKGNLGSTNGVGWWRFVKTLSLLVISVSLGTYLAAFLFSMRRSSFTVKCSRRAETSQTIPSLLLSRLYLVQWTALMKNQGQIALFIFLSFCIMFIML